MRHRKRAHDPRRIDLEAEPFDKRPRPAVELMPSDDARQFAKKDVLGDREVWASASSWWMRAMPCALASRGSRNSTLLPPMRISPELGSNSPPSMRISVDLPAPFSPRRA
jgi:hypothetical protein